MANRPNIHYHNATIHHSDHETKLANPLKTLKTADGQQSFYPSPLSPPVPPQSTQLQQRQHYLAEQYPVHAHRQAKSFDDSTLYSKKHTSFAHYPLTDLKHHHSQKHRRHSSTSRIKANTDHYHRTNSASETKNSNFISSITNNFMSFGAPFLFDWRLFCERGKLIN